MDRFLTVPKKGFLWLMALLCLSVEAASAEPLSMVLHNQAGPTLHIDFNTPNHPLHCDKPSLTLLPQTSATLACEVRAEATPGAQTKVFGFVTTIPDFYYDLTDRLPLHCSYRLAGAVKKIFTPQETYEYSLAAGDHIRCANNDDPQFVPKALSVSATATSTGIAVTFAWVPNPTEPAFFSEYDY